MRWAFPILSISTVIRRHQLCSLSALRRWAAAGVKVWRSHTTEENKTLLKTGEIRSSSLTIAKPTAIEFYRICPRLWIYAMDILAVPRLWHMKLSWRCTIYVQCTVTATAPAKQPDHRCKEHTNDLPRGSHRVSQPTMGQIYWLLAQKDGSQRLRVYRHKLDVATVRYSHPCLE